MGRLASQEFHGIRKARQGSFRRKGHPHDGSHTARHTQELKQTQAEPSRQVAQE